MVELRFTLPLDRFSLELDLEACEKVTCFFGPSGSGKTSLLESVAGLRSPLGRLAFDDQVWLDTRAGIHLPPDRRGVGYVPQDSLLFPHLDVRANLRFGGSHLFDGVVDVLELEPLLSRGVTTLSGGERQRVALGRALCSGPRLMLLDEPLASLDAALRGRVLPFLRRVRREFDQPMLLVSHDPTVVQALADEVVLLERGRATERGEPTRVLSRLSGYRNLLALPLARHQDDVSVLSLGESEVLVPRVEAEPGAEALFELPAADILLALESPEQISARNVLPATVTSLQEEAHTVMVRARPDGSDHELLAEVTTGSTRRLKLGPGKPVVLVFKSSSCRVL